MMRAKTGKLFDFVEFFGGWDALINQIINSLIINHHYVNQLNNQKILRLPIQETICKK